MEIGSILNGLVTLIKTELNLSDEGIALANVAFREDTADGAGVQDKIVVSLVNVEEEKALRYNHTLTVNGQNAAGNPNVIMHNPPISVNLYLIFSSHRQNDTTFSKSLDEIGQIISFFQKKYIFTRKELLGANSTLPLDRLVFELFTLSFEQMNHLWGVLGGKYIPSVVYKVRLFTIKHIPPEPQPLIRNQEASASGVQ